MNMRKVIVVTTQTSQKIERMTSATTFGQLKNDFSEITFDGSKAMVRETKTSLESNDSVLPTGDFVLFVMPQKTKAGFDPALYGRNAEGIIQAIGAAYNEQSELIKRLMTELEELKNKVNHAQGFIPPSLKAPQVNDFFGVDDDEEVDDELLSEARAFQEGLY